MAGIGDPLVSIPGYLAVRYSFRISGLLRPRGLPRVVVCATIVWPVCPGRSTMRRCVDVDVRYRRLLDRRGNCCCASILAASVGRTAYVAIRVGTQCYADGPAKDGDY